VNTTDLAWAAGVYDGEGSASTYLPKQRKSRVRQIAVYQSGDTMPPPLLFRFRAAVGEVGLIHGPARGSLYQWHSKRHVVVDAVSELLWPWIGEVKRAQLRKAAREVHRTAPAEASTRWSESEEAACAAGFFDGEGTTRFAEIERVVAMLYPYADVVKREQMTACLHHVRASRASRS
jgi:hypothetical protein